MKIKGFSFDELFTSRNGDTDLKKEDITGRGISLITSGLENNGVAGKTDKPAAIFQENTITVDMFGNAFYRDFPYKMVTHARVFALLPLKKINRETGLYMTALMNFLPRIFSYDNMCSWAKIKDLKLYMPVKVAFSPDYDLIENLIGGGIDMSKIDTSTWKEFRIGDIFDVDSWIYGKNKQYVTRFDNIVPNSIAVISGITTNNGINYYTKDVLEKSEIYKDCLTISTRGEYSGTVTYHDEPFCLANNILVMPMPNLSKNAKLFVGSLITNLGYGGYSNYPTKDSLKEDVILLPATESEEIDFEYMEKYIRAIEKQTIAKIYEGKGKVIEKTKKIVAAH